MAVANTEDDVVDGPEQLAYRARADAFNGPRRPDPSDAEPAAAGQDTADGPTQRTAHRLAKISSEKPPAYDSQSNGAVEVGVMLIRGCSGH